MVHYCRVKYLFRAISPEGRRARHSTRDRGLRLEPFLRVESSAKNCVDYSVRLSIMSLVDTRKVIVTLAGGKCEGRLLASL